MERIKKVLRISLPAMICAVIVLFSAGEILASENGGDWRPTYDLIMRWFNFLILVFIIVKFGKDPLMNFLHGRKKELASEIEQIENKHENVLADIQKTQKKLDERESYLADLKQNVQVQAEKKKQQIIEDASVQAKRMLKDATTKANYQLIEARNAFKAEMIDVAINMASERLPKEVYVEDNYIMVEKYLSAVAKA
ncbi:F-type H+-transporting ATPase subunit b [Candidatus Magnetomoraceae bacterium gMMP-1]